MLKYLVVVLVIGVALWLMTARRRPPEDHRAPGPKAPELPPTMVSCAHCGLHLPATDAVLDGSRVYCCDAHRERGPRARAGT